MEHGKLPVNHEFDSLGIGTLQGYLKKLGYYHGLGDTLREYFNFILFALG